MIDPHTLKPIEDKPLEVQADIKQPAYFNEIVGFFQTATSAPTLPPRYTQDQIQIYSNRLYIYDSTNKAWKYTTLT